MSTGEFCAGRDRLNILPLRTLVTVTMNQWRWQPVFYFSPAPPPLIPTCGSREVVLEREMGGKRERERARERLYREKVRDRLYQLWLCILNMRDKSLSCVSYFFFCFFSFFDTYIRDKLSRVYSFFTVYTSIYKTTLELPCVLWRCGCLDDKRNEKY
jgi:hypothetical protein